MSEIDDDTDLEKQLQRRGKVFALLQILLAGAGVAGCVVLHRMTASQPAAKQQLLWIAIAVGAVASVGFFWSGVRELTRR